MQLRPLATTVGVLPALETAQAERRRVRAPAGRCRQRRRTRPERAPSDFANRSTLPGHARLDAMAVVVPRLGVAVGAPRSIIGPVRMSF